MGYGNREKHLRKSRCFFSFVVRMYLLGKKRAEKMESKLDIKELIDYT